MKRTSPWKKKHVGAVDVKNDRAWAVGAWSTNETLVSAEEVARGVDGEVLKWNQAQVSVRNGTGGKRASQTSVSEVRGEITRRKKNPRFTIVVCRGGCPAKMR